MKRILKAIYVDLDGVQRKVRVSTDNSYQYQAIKEVILRYTIISIEEK